MKRDETRTEILLDDLPGPIGSLDELANLSLRALTARIWQTCCWSSLRSGRSNVGDYRFLIVEFSPSGDDSACLYVQFWSEPEEPALMEVCSGNWNPGALKYVWREQRRALEQLGFKIGGQAKNFQKTLDITSPDDAERAASETLAILFDIFGYRGREPVNLKIHQGARSEQAAVHTSITSEDFLKLARLCGFRASRVPGDEAPVIALERQGFQSIAILRRRGRGSLFDSVLLRASADGRTVAEATLELEGGVTTAWLRAALRRWRAVGRRVGRAEKKRSRPGRGRSSRHAPSVH